MCCSTLPCVAVCCSTLQCVAVLQHDAVCFQIILSPSSTLLLSIILLIEVLQCVAVCCSTLQCVAVCFQNVLSGVNDSTTMNTSSV